MNPTEESPSLFQKLWGRVEPVDVVKPDVVIKNTTLVTSSAGPKEVILPNQVLPIAKQIEVIKSPNISSEFKVVKRVATPIVHIADPIVGSQLVVGDLAEVQYVKPEETIISNSSVVVVDEDVLDEKDAIVTSSDFPNFYEYLSSYYPYLPKNSWISMYTVVVAILFYLIYLQYFVPIACLIRPTSNAELGALALNLFKAPLTKCNIIQTNTNDIYDIFAKTIPMWCFYTKSKTIDTVFNLFYNGNEATSPLGTIGVSAEVLELVNLVEDYYHRVKPDVIVPPVVVAPVVPPPVVVAPIVSAAPPVVVRPTVPAPVVVAPGVVRPAVPAPVVVTPGVVPAPVVVAPAVVPAPVVAPVVVPAPVVVTPVVHPLQKIVFNPDSKDQEYRIRSPMDPCVGDAQCNLGARGSCCRTNIGLVPAELVKLTRIKTKTFNSNSCKDPTLPCYPCAPGLKMKYIGNLRSVKPVDICTAGTNQTQLAVPSLLYYAYICTGTEVIPVQPSVVKIPMIPTVPMPTIDPVLVEDHVDDQEISLQDLWSMHNNMH
jgi:hypothetical protein